MKEKKISKWIQDKIGLRAYSNNHYVKQSFCRFFAKETTPMRQKEKLNYMRYLSRADCSGVRRSGKGKTVP